jgi:hypothetical protein
MFRRLLSVALIVAAVAGLIVQAMPTQAAPRELITTSLVAYWDMDETSGNRADSVGANTLTDNNTVGNATGKISTAANFVSANSEYLSIADNADTSIGSSFSLAGWFRVTNTTNVQFLVARDNNGATRDYTIDVENGYVRFIVFDSSNAFMCITDSPSISANTWTFLAATWDEAGDDCAISINAGTQSVNSAYSIAGNTSDKNLVTSFGRREDGSGYLNGDMDEWGLWKKTLSTTEISDLYNANAGCTYSFTTCDSSIPTATPTATNTPTTAPTATPTNTPTPTPGVVIVLTPTPVATATSTPINGDLITIPLGMGLGFGKLQMPYIITWGDFGTWLLLLALLVSQLFIAFRRGGGND